MYLQRTEDGSRELSVGGVQQHYYVPASIYIVSGRTGWRRSDLHSPCQDRTLAIAPPLSPIRKVDRLAVREVPLLEHVIHEAVEDPAHLPALTRSELDGGIPDTSGESEEGGVRTATQLGPS